jgi:metallo-beta-lactamase class B
VDDPQHSMALPIPLVGRVETFDDGDTLRAGSLALVAHLTPGHTPGGTSWTWRSCAEQACVNFVYADSQTPLGDETFLFSRNSRYPAVVQDFEKGFAALESLSCDILITPHPSASDLWNRVQGTNDTKLIDRSACRRYAQRARRALAERLATETRK